MAITRAHIRCHTSRLGQTTLTVTTFAKQEKRWHQFPTTRNRLQPARQRVRNLTTSTAVTGPSSPKRSIASARSKRSSHSSHVAPASHYGSTENQSERTGLLTVIPRQDRPPSTQDPWSCESEAAQTLAQWPRCRTVKDRSNVPRGNCQSKCN